VGVVVSIAVLSLASFLVLRSTTRRSLVQMDGDNRRLAALLEVSRSLAAEQFEDEAAQTAAQSALMLVKARAAFVFNGQQAQGTPTPLAAAGAHAQKLEQQIAGPLFEVAGLTQSEGRPTLRGPAEAGAALAAVPLPGDGGCVGVLVAVAPEGSAGFDADEVDALTTLGALVAVALRNADLRDAQRNFFTHVTDILITALDAHLGYHTGHAERVARYANRIGRQLGFDDHRMERLHFGALLHDIGMLKIESHLQMTRETCAKHTVLGSRMLARIRLWEDLAPFVHHHHEHWDGAGYPDGLAGEAIPLEARIIALCDALDSMTSSASYKDPVPLEQAVAEIQRCSGTQFDPGVVGAFLDVVRAGGIEIEDAA
jgi:putative nucleotidyltransferase with HDIG domain